MNSTRLNTTLTLPLFELGVFRFSVLLLVSSVMIALGGLDIRLPKTAIPFVIGLAVTQVSYAATLYGAILYLPVTTVTCLKQAISMMIGFAVTHMTTRVLNVSRAISVTLCLFGTILLVQPSAMLHSFLPTTPNPLTRPICSAETLEDVHRPTSESNSVNVTYVYVSTFMPKESYYSDSRPTAESVNDQAEDSHLFISYTLGCICPFLSTGMWFIINEGLNDVNPFVINFWISLLCGIVLSMLAGIFNTLVFPTSKICVALLFTHCVAFSLNVTCSIIVNQNFEIMMTAVLSTLELTGVLCAQYTLLEKINPGRKNSLEIVGALLVIVGNTVGPVFELYKEARIVENSTEDEEETGVTEMKQLSN